ncbi:MAG: hypothetical protein WBW88_15040, partial [Rhodothermales bacterium]
PDLRRPTEVDRLGSRRDFTARHRPKMVGIDFHPDAEGMIKIDAEIGGCAAYRLRKSNGCSAMQESQRLFRCFIDRHGGDNMIPADYREAYPQMLNHTVGAAVIDFFEREGSKPNRRLIVHSGQLTDKAAETLRV